MILNLSTQYHRIYSFIISNPKKTKLFSIHLRLNLKSTINYLNMAIKLKKEKKKNFLLSFICPRQYVEG